MWSVVLVALLFAVSVHPHPHLHDSNIVGGIEAGLGRVPYQAALEYKGRFRCGGSLIKRDVVITAAHCVEDQGVPIPPEELTVRTSTIERSYGGQIRPVRQVIIHDKYNHTLVFDDIALMKLESPVLLDKATRLVKIEKKRKPSSGSLATVSGWGRTAEDGEMSWRLRFAEVPVLSDENCKGVTSIGYRITDGMLCAGYPEGKIDMCKGDSGGPLVYRGKLIGIVSWSAGCARSGSPGVYTDVSKYATWINKNLEKLNQ